MVAKGRGTVTFFNLLMDMAKKANTQLICFSGLGGDSVYNCFDNIYVLNLEKSNIPQTIQNMRSNPIKGEAIKKMVLSQFKVEQTDFLDWEEGLGVKSL